MRSTSIRSPERHTSFSPSAEGGFTLLEVILAMTLLAAGLAAVLGLFSGGLKSAEVSEQYLQAAALADSRLAELELVDFHPNDTAGTFVENENYRWELDIQPFEAEPYNLPGEGLMQVRLKVTWNDLSQPRGLELVTLWREGQTLSLDDSVLEKTFYGGSSSLQEDAGSSATPAASTGASATAPSTKVTR